MSRTVHAFDLAKGKEWARVSAANKAISTIADAKQLNASLIGKARVINSRASPVRPEELHHDGSLEEIDPAGALERWASVANHREAGGVTIQAIGGNLTSQPVFCPP